MFEGDAFRILHGKPAERRELGCEDGDRAVTVEIDPDGH
jgi:hypothetical protein